MANSQYQAYLVRSPIVPGQFSVFLVGLQTATLRYAGDLPPMTASQGAERLSVLVDAVMDSESRSTRYASSRAL